ncbi:MAG: Tol-Pal system beta propeller repeat protein TolB [Alphaproteobacteria bacterium]
MLAAPQAAAQNPEEGPSITIKDGKVEPVSIAIPDFMGESEQEQTFGRDLAAVIANNLDRSGLFAPIDPRAFIDKPHDFNTKPRFGDWRIINARLLLTGKATMQDDGRLRVDFFLWDVFGGKEMIGLRFFSTPEGWRRVAHLISDQVYERVTGEQGYFDTRIVFVSESGPKVNRIKRLAIIDQDGANPQFLTSGRELVLTPRFSPTDQQVVFMSYANNVPRVYLLDIESGRREVVGDFPGMTFAPRFSSDGRQIIMSLERNGNSDVYVMDLRTRRTERLTNDPAIDTSPSFSPDGEQVTFNSDRGGSQQIYVMDRDGSNVRRITFGKGRYATPVWSPRGDLIAFTRLYKGKFYIGVIEPDGENERLLTESFLDEGPTWAPNGRVLMFFRQTPTRRDGSGGTVRLWSVDLTGHNERPINTPGDASDPAWSPLISEQGAIR